MKFFPHALLCAALLSSVPAASNPAIGQAPDFAITDMRQLADVPFTIGANRYSRKAKPESILFSCRSCRSDESVHIRVTTEIVQSQAKLKSGQDTVATLEAACKNQYRDCRMEATEVEGATGTISTMSLGPIAVSSLVVSKGVRTLIIQSLAATPEIALQNVKAAREQIAPLIVGRN
jgi:hypothetical protein